MRHSYFGKQLSRNTDERKRLLKNLAKSLIIAGAITTSRAKAQAVRGDVEKMITKAKKGNDIAKRSLYSSLGDRVIAEKLMEMAKTRFSPRNSGYTRIVKVGPRRGDATEVVVLAFVDEEVKTEVIAPAKTEKAKELKKPETKEAPKKTTKAPKKAEK